MTYQRILFGRPIGQVLMVPMPTDTFSPLDFGSDLTLWLDANEGVYNDAGSTLAADGETVQQWNDRSSYGHHVSQATAGDRPTFRSTGLNSQPTIEFVATNDEHLLNASFAMGGGTDVSVFAVAQMHSACESFGRIAAFIADGQTNDFDNAGSASLVCRNNGGNAISSARLSSALGNKAITLTTNHRMGAVFDGANVTPYVDNSAGTTGATSDAFAASGDIYVGHQNPSDTAAAWDGFISELVIVKRELTSNERAQLNTYFSAKWGL